MNRFTELAIGAPGNNMVTLVRCMATVAIVIEAEIPDLTVHYIFYLYHVPITLAPKLHLKKISSTLGASPLQFLQ